GDEQPIAVTLRAAGEVGLHALAATVSVAGDADTPTPIAVADLTLAAGQTQVLAGTLHGVAPGAARLTLSATAAADRGPAPPPAGEVRDVVVRAGPALVVDPLAFPARVEAGAPFPLAVTVRNTGDVDLTSGALDLTLAGGAAGAVPAFTVPAGGTTAVAVAITPAAGGTPVELTLAARGLSALSGRPVAAAAVHGLSGDALDPAGLVVTAAASPAQATVGQDLAVAVTVHNPGAVEVEPALVTVAAADPGVALLDGAAEVASLSFTGLAVPPGGTLTLSAPARAKTAGASTVTVDASGTDPVSGQTVAAGAVAALAVTAAPRLVVSPTAPAAVNFGQTAVLAVQVRNEGGTDARAVTLTVVDESATPGLVIPGQPAPAVIDRLVAGASQSVTVPLVAGAAPGTVQLAMSVAGLDDNGAGPVASAPVTATLAVQPPAALALTATLTPARVSAGQRVTFTLNVTNTGATPITLTALPAPAVSPTGTAALTVATAPAFTAGTILAGGGGTAFAWDYDTAGSGTATVTAVVQGEEVGTGTPITPAGASAGPVQVQRPAALRVAVDVSPSPVSLGDAMGVAVTVTNDGEATAAAVAPAAFGADATATAAGARVPAGSLDVLGGASAVFYYPFTAQSLGTFTAWSAATGADGNSGAPLTAPAAVSNVVVIVASQPPQVAITQPAPGAGATVAPGGELVVEVGALADVGHTVADITLAVDGPGHVLGGASVTTTGRGTGASFIVLADPLAPAGAALTLTASAHDEVGTAATSAPSVATIRTAPLVVAVTCAPASLAAAAGHLEEVRLTAAYSDGSERDVTVPATWSSSNGAVASVTEGVVSPLTTGTAVITGGFGGVTGACTVVVTNPVYVTDPARLVVASAGTAPVRFLRVANPTAIDLTTDPGTAWSTSDPAVAQVSSGGIVTGVGAGLATITGCNTATSRCASTLVLVGRDVELPGGLGTGAIGIAGAQHFGSLTLHAGTDLYAYGPTMLDVAVDSLLIVEAGAVLRADGAPAPAASANAPRLPRRGEGGAAGPGGGGGGAGAGDGSRLCGGDNCGGDGAPPGANACKLASCAGGVGGGPGGGGGAPATGMNNAGGGGGHDGAGGRGGGPATGSFAGAAGAAGQSAPQGGGSGGGGGTGTSGQAPGGGGGGGGGVIRIVAAAQAVIRIDGRVTARGGDGASLRTGSSRGPGGGGAGGRILLHATGGSIEGTGLVSAAGGTGGGPAAEPSQCGGAGGGGGGAVVLDASIKGPFLIVDVAGGDGGAACAGGGQAGEPGGRGAITR
ncbi:MAG TPA: hypothetical protein VGQ83_15250, partial [Polyangia bacterium]